MIYQLEVLYRRLRRWFNRSEWLIRLLGNKPVESTGMKTGLIIIQIDGLAYQQLNTALAKKRMPFLTKLITKEHYHLHTLYSGTPSTTPAVQAELFYGVKTAVPAFSFRSQDSHQVVCMNRYQASVDVEKRLSEQAEPLLKGGSSYSNIYSGGAKEANFCAPSIGWSGLMSLASLPTILVFVLVNLYSFIRVSALMVLEFLLAFVDFFRGLIARENLLRELQFVPTRVVISILLRELVTIGTKLDIARGLPIVHLNLLGYDEQAHRRGPHSEFAHWSLKGIDDAIGRIWRAAKASHRRDYDVWVYSDHGQQETIAYEKLHGETVSSAINRVLASVEHATAENAIVTQVQGTESHRARYLGGKWIQKILPFHNGDFLSDNPSKQAVTVTAMGPIGSVYLAASMNHKQTEKLAIALVHSAKIPLVFACQRSHYTRQKGEIRAWNKNGVYHLPQDGPRLFGQHHPFLNEVTEDIVRLCQHPESGDLLISGFNTDDEPYCTFAMENGSHGGPGPVETHAFALLPCDTPMPGNQKGYLRPVDLYEVGMQLLGRKPKKAVHKSVSRLHKRPINTSLRILTYNVHSCFGMDGKLTPHRIAKVIAQYQPDIVALQELDVGKSRTQHVDQAQIISQFLRMEFHFHPVIHLEEERYGNAILTHLPIALVKAGNLPLIVNKPRFEPRGAIWVSVEVNGTNVQIINTHFGFRKIEHLPQATALLGKKWLNAANPNEPIILCGDFNFLPHSPAYKLIAEQFKDLQLELQDHRPQMTFPGRFPGARIDHVFANSMVNPLKVTVPRTHLTRKASDHLPLIVDVQLT